MLIVNSFLTKLICEQAIGKRRREGGRVGRGERRGEGEGRVAY